MRVEDFQVGDRVGIWVLAYMGVPGGHLHAGKVGTVFQVIPRGQTPPDHVYYDGAIGVRYDDPEPVSEAFHPVRSDIIATHRRPDPGTSEQSP
jgi:hypothetical protein